MKWQEKNQDQLKIYDVIRPKDVVHDTKNNMNMTSVHEYVKIVWINTQTCQNLYYTLNTTWHRKKEHKWIHELTGLDMILYAIKNITMK